jgi:hypothetical protein
MTLRLTSQEAAKLKRFTDEPWTWLRENVEEVVARESEFYTLLEEVKVVWEEYRTNRINLAFLINWSTANNVAGLLNIKDVSLIQKRQNSQNSQLIFEIDLAGFVLDEIDLGSEIDPASITLISQSRSAVILWFGNNLDVFCKGIKWNPKNKSETLKEMKLKKRDLLPLTDYKRILKTHFEQYVKGEAGFNYWFPGKKNKILQSSPEKLFQKSLFMFLKNECECDASPEAMFKNSSRCDVRAAIDYDVYFFEIKWIGYCATKKEGSAVISADEPREETVDNAIAGAYQTKAYLEDNNSAEYDNKIKLGVIVVYDGYPERHVPISYPDEINKFPLLETAEFALVSLTPSVLGKKAAKQVRKTAKKR